MRFRNPLKHRKLLIILGVIAGLLFIGRIILPSILLKKTNEFLAEFSPVYHVQIDDLDLSFIRMAYRVEGVQAKLKKSGDVFLKVQGIDTSLAWNELFKGNLLADVTVVAANIFVTDKVINTIKNASTPPKDDAGAVQEKLVPLRIERVMIRDSSIEIAELPQLPPEQRWRISEIQTRISNVTPGKTDAVTLATVQATVMDSAKVKGLAKARIAPEKLAWDMDMEMRGFDLVAANPVLKRLLPFTFTAGTMDMFLEAKSEKPGSIVGYVKPYLRKIDVVGNQTDFAGAKHFIFEVAGAIGNLILRRSDEKSIASKIPFSKAGGSIKVDTGAAVANALEHGFDDKIAPTIEDSIQLK